MVNAFKQWEEFLNPELTRPRLISASIYIACYESLKQSIIDRLREFFWSGFNEKGNIIDPKYSSDVLSRNKSVLYASLDWLKENDVINDSDIVSFENVKRCRNQLAHGLLALLADGGLPPDFKSCFDSMVALLRKIEVWWITNVEIPTNPDYDGKEIGEKGIIPGPIMSIQLLHDIALGSVEESRFYYEQFKKELGNRGA